MTSLLVIDGVSGGYGAIPVLHDVNLHVNEGQIAVLLGANGAGKTTTLRAISGIVNTVGDISFAGQRLNRRRPEAIASLGIAHVPQGRGTFTSLTVEDNLRLGAYLRKGKDEKADVNRWLQVFPRLRERRNQKAGALSGGEQQMLAIARAMMLRPRMLLLDEPSLGLAPIVTQELFRELETINREMGTTMLIVEQNANLALRVASWASLLEAGHVVASGTPDDLTADEAVRRAYLGY